MSDRGGPRWSGGTRRQRGRHLVSTTAESEPSDSVRQKRLRCTTVVCQVRGLSRRVVYHLPYKTLGRNFECLGPLFRPVAKQSLFTGVLPGSLVVVHVLVWVPGRVSVVCGTRVGPDPRETVPRGPVYELVSVRKSTVGRGVRRLVHVLGRGLEGFTRGGFTVEVFGTLLTGDKCVASATGTSFPWFDDRACPSRGSPRTTAPDGGTRGGRPEQGSST